MGLFGRKKSSQNVAGEVRSPLPPPPQHVNVRPLELSEEISTPLYARFAKVRSPTSSLDLQSPVFSTNRVTAEPPSPSLALFDGSSMNTKAGQRLQQGREQQASSNSRPSYEDGPPASMPYSRDPPRPTARKASVEQQVISPRSLASPPRSPTAYESTFGRPMVESPTRVLTLSKSQQQRVDEFEARLNAGLSHSAKGSGSQRGQPSSSNSSRPPITTSSESRTQRAPSRSRADESQLKSPTHRSRSPLPPNGQTPDNLNAHFNHSRAPSPSRPYVSPENQSPARSPPPKQYISQHIIDHRPLAGGDSPLDERPSTLFATPNRGLRAPSPAFENQTDDRHHRSVARDSPPVSGPSSPVAGRRRHSIQSIDLKGKPPVSGLNAGHLPLKRAPSPSPGPSSMMDPKSPRRGGQHPTGLPTPASSSHSLHTQTQYSSPPLSNSARWTPAGPASTALAREDSMSSSGHTLWTNPSSVRTSMTSVESSAYSHDVHTRKAGVSRSASKTAPLPTTMEAVSPPPPHPDPGLPRSESVYQATTSMYDSSSSTGRGTRLSDLMLLDEADPFAKAPPPSMDRSKETSSPPSPQVIEAVLPSTQFPASPTFTQPRRAPSPLPPTERRGNSPLPPVTPRSKDRELSRPTTPSGKEQGVAKLRKPPPGGPRPRVKSSAGREVTPDLISKPVPRSESSLLSPLTTPMDTWTSPSPSPSPSSFSQPSATNRYSDREPTFYPLDEHVANPALLSGLLAFLSYRDFAALWAVSRLIRRTLEEKTELRELVLAKFLASTGYVRWKFEERKEPIVFSLKDLNAYLRGVDIPTHRYVDFAEAAFNPDDPSLTLSLMTESTRAYTRLVFRLRAQAEIEQLHYEQNALVQHQQQQQHSQRNGGTSRRPSETGPPVSFSRAPLFPESESGHGHGPVSRPPSRTRNGRPLLNGASSSGSGANGRATASYRFRSPLFRNGHAPLLRVFVPSVEGEWLSDENVMECERELKRAGVMGLLKVGDVVWDIAVGDEGNAGRMVWDGTYLIDLDYTYSTTGEVPAYIDSLCYPPSYWHKIIRVPGNPIFNIDIAPYAAEIAANLALLQDRVQTETPQGQHHTVVRWIHRSCFRLRGETPLLSSVPAAKRPMGAGGTPLIDPAWEGLVYIEAEGTNEGLEDLQARCGDEVTLFPVRTAAASLSSMAPKKTRAPPGKSVFRMMRAQSKPGELWLKCVRDKERVN